MLTNTFVMPLSQNGDYVGGHAKYCDYVNVIELIINNRSKIMWSTAILTVLYGLVYAHTSLCSHHVLVWQTDDM